MTRFRPRQDLSKVEGGPDPELGQSELAAIEDRWMEARCRGDIASSESLIDDTYTGVTSDGHVQTKSDFVDAIRRSAGSLAHVEHMERSIRISGPVAISTGLVADGAEERTLRFRYMRIFLHSQGAWRLIASQSTRVQRNPS